MSGRALSLRLHRWVGLLAAIFLFLEGATGGIIAWGPLLYRRLESVGPPQPPPEHPVPAGPAARPLAALQSGLEQDHPGFRVNRLSLRTAPDLAWSADLQSPGQPPVTVWFDPHTGQTIAERTAPAPPGAWMLAVIARARRLHGDVFAGAGLLLLAVSGLILWWPRRIFSIRRPASARQANFDLHGALGFYASACLLVFAGTAMLMGFSRSSIALLRLVTPASTRAASGPPALQAGVRRAPRLATFLDLDQAKAKVLEVHPGAIVTSVRLFNDHNGTTEFAYRPAPGAGPARVTLVNAATGELQEPQVPAQMALPEKIVRYWAPRIHEGELFGNLSLWISGLIGFALAALAVTGPLIWWLRRKSEAGRP
jgi:uncharacterized iron-regulated membrane protein